MTAARTRSVGAAAALLALTIGPLGVLAGCGGSNAPAKGGSARDVLAAAKKNFDDAASVHLKLTTDSKPSSDAVLGADGTLTHQPAFKGEVTVQLSGFNADVPIVSVDGKVYAKLPLTPKYATIDPSEYSAPDPADFADTDKGISGLLLEMTDLTKDGTERAGKQVLTRYSGTLDGSLVAPIIPSASPSDSYDATVGIDQHDRIVTLDVTGDFFSGGGDETYRIEFSDYDKSVKITAP
ncbi:MAG TPA: LppX_LprAFG lipoprotein [Marmoricola sp.]|nr:LppX_LprAFG lipoprotein [Marmoricola sp.]